MKADFGLEYVETSQWGGLLVTLVVAITGIVASMPLGILLALGRRSKMPIVQYFSIAFIEVWRGVPLITVLFMASVMLPLFLPPGINFDKLTARADRHRRCFRPPIWPKWSAAACRPFRGASMKRRRRSGLPYWSMMSLIVLPQA